jgi:hypothetical protein
MSAAVVECYFSHKGSTATRQPLSLCKVRESPGRRVDLLTSWYCDSSCQAW